MVMWFVKASKEVPPMSLLLRKRVGSGGVGIFLPVSVVVVRWAHAANYWVLLVLWFWTFFLTSPTAILLGFLCFQTKGWWIFTLYIPTSVFCFSGFSLI